MGEYFVTNLKMVAIECYKCHIVFAVPKEFDDKQRELNEDGDFCCPNGHHQVYIGKSLKNRLKQKEAAIRNLTEQNSHLNECCINYQEKAKRNDYRARKYKGDVTRLKKVIA